MCGITGFFVNGPRAGCSEVLRRMTASLRHRGPDDEGAYIDSHMALGVRRLSVIDLETGRQPISNEDHTVHVVLNGEIYNFTELRKRLEGRGHTFRTHSDAEVATPSSPNWTGCSRSRCGMHPGAVCSSHAIGWAKSRSTITPGRPRSSSARSCAHSSSAPTCPERSASRASPAICCSSASRRRTRCWPTSRKSRPGTS
ncbi:MAG: hypothetical protein DMD84_16995 [Candidatus Rokuibacteriota bacterium]|nr:MAG: hypothetical protein DMD84_16995 [Candidatus Rokubacteria bacterium]